MYSCYNFGSERGKNMASRSELREKIMTILYQITLYKKSKMEYDVEEVIKESFSIEIIEDGQGWIDMMYDVNRFQTKIPEKEDLELIINKYFILISKINEYIEKKYGE